MGGIVKKILLDISIYAIYPLMAFFISSSLTALCIRIMPKLGYIDNPGGRHIHTRVVPRGGGIAIALSIFLTVFAFALTANGHAGMELLKKGLLPASLLLITGLIDDRIELKSIVKLLAQIVVGVLIWYGFDRPLTIYSYEVPKYISLVITVLWVITVINAFNLIDGLDGLATGLAIISGSCLAVWFLFRGNIQALFMLIFIGACLGFLRYNFSPAKIFLGDTGSMFLGLFLAVSGGGVLDSAVTFTSLLLPLLIVGVPLFDVGLAVWRRSVRKLLDPDAAGIMEADSDHLHHRILREKKKHSTTALCMYVISLVFAFLALVVLLIRDFAPAMALLLLLLTILLMLRYMAGIELLDSVDALRQRVFAPGRKILCMAAHPLFDLAVVAAASVLFSFFVLRSINFPLVVYMSAPPVLLLMVCGIYKVFWLRSNLVDRGKIFVVTAIGAVISVAVAFGYIFYTTGTVCKVMFTIGSMLFVLSLCSVLFFERFLLHYLESVWYCRFVHNYERNSWSRTVVYGGGFLWDIYRMYMGCAGNFLHRTSVCGIIDDNPKLKNMIIRGVKVRGSLDELEKIWKKHPFDRLIISCKPSPEKLETIKNFCLKHDIQCGEFNLSGVDFNAGISWETLNKTFGKKRRIWLCALADLVILLFASVIYGRLLTAEFRLWHILCGVLPGMILYHIFPVYRVVWGVNSARDNWKMLKLTLMGSLISVVLFYLFRMYINDVTLIGNLFISVSALYVFLCCSGIMMFRFMLQAMNVFRLWKKITVKKEADREKVIIVGGGLGCRMLLYCILRTNFVDLRHILLGVVDDDNALQKMKVHGLQVIGKVAELPELYRKNRFDRVIVSANISDETATVIRNFSESFKEVKVDYFSAGEKLFDDQKTF